jgi:hypothetical protein
VMCAIPRSPVQTGINPGFFIDGNHDNTLGIATRCMVFVHEFDGTSIASKTVSTTQPTYDLFVSFLPAELPTFAYVSVICTLPTNSILRGITAVQ